MAHLSKPVVMADDVGVVGIDQQPHEDQRSLEETEA